MLDTKEAESDLERKVRTKLCQGTVPSEFVVARLGIKNPDNPWYNMNFAYERFKKLEERSPSISYDDDSAYMSYFSKIDFKKDPQLFIFAYKKGLLFKVSEDAFHNTLSDVEETFSEDVRVLRKVMELYWNDLEDEVNARRTGWKVLKKDFEDETAREIYGQLIIGQESIEPEKPRRATFIRPRDKAEEPRYINPEVRHEKVTNISDYFHPQA